MVVCHEEYRFLVLEQLRGVGVQPPSVLLEPVARNTAPAVTAAALLAVRAGGDPVLFVMPADHLVQDVQTFADAAARAAVEAARGTVMTLGVRPDSPNTGFGYLQLGAPLAAGAVRELQRFVEKPAEAQAREMLATGSYEWNSGMFLVRASVWLALVERFAPAVARSVASAVEAGAPDGAFFRLQAEAFGESPSVSIDYGVMEPLTEARQTAAAEGLPPCGSVALDAGWSDIGSWAAVQQMGEPDPDGNVRVGDTYAEDCRDSLVYSTHRFVAALGVEGVVVVETPDAVLVADRRHAQEVRRISDHLREAGRNESATHRKVFRPWGAYEQMDSGERFQVKRLTVKPGASLSVQMHHHRAEHWVVVRGTARVTRGEEVFLLTENESTFIPVGTRHRLENPGRVTLEVVEVQSGSYLGEDDIVRFEDVYGREH